MRLQVRDPAPPTWQANRERAAKMTVTRDGQVTVLVS